MHRLAAIPGAWTPGEPPTGVVFIDQTPAPLVVLTAADTDIQVLAQAVPRLPADFPAVRVTNLLYLQQQLTLDTYAEAVLASAQAIVVRLLGGRSYWSYGLEVVKAMSDRTGAALFILPGDDRPDPDMSSHSTVSLALVHQLWRYFTEGGIDNWVHGLQFVAAHCLQRVDLPPPPQELPRMGLYPWPPLQAALPKLALPKLAKVGLLFYRAHALAGNTAAIAALCEALSRRQLQPVPIFVQSLQDPGLQAELLGVLQPPDQPGIQLLLNTTSFSLAKLSRSAPQLDLWQRLDVPVLQVILSGGTVEQWQTDFRGLSPRDLAMNVALPEVDGRVITRAISFKQVQQRHPQLEAEVVTYEPLPDRIEFVADLAANWVKLRQTPVPERRLALILANYPSRDGRLANGVGLDTPASCVAILQALQQAGYQTGDLPQTGDELIGHLTTSRTNDPEGRELRPIAQGLPLEVYQQYFATLPEAVQRGICDRWGEVTTASLVTGPWSLVKGEGGLGFAIAGVQFGQVFVGIQPPRGYDLDPALNYHAPDLEPPHDYLAFYCWLRQEFGAQAIVHVGKHGNLEWLPGKSLALSEACYPEVALGPLPHFYPFIVNDPGEGTQAKRRAQAVILDHLTPPLTRAELYGPLEQLEALIDEYYDAQGLDPSRLPVIRDRITTLVQQTHLDQELPDQTLTSDTWTSFLTRADGYLCELKEAQIRDGLHIFGHCPQGRQLRDLVVAIARYPGPDRLGLTRALAQDWGLDFDPLTAEPTTPLTEIERSLVLGPWSLVTGVKLEGAKLRNVGDAIALLEDYAAVLIEDLLTSTHPPIHPPGQGDLAPTEIPHPHTSQTLAWIATYLLPSLHQTPQELTHLLRGLDGCYIPSGPAGAPTRGRPEVLPTGRNFYSVDIRGLPTESAWDVGRKAAEVVIEQYTQEQGDYPRTLGLSLWGTATMRTGGDDLAEALALLGVQPVWEGPSRRVVGFEILPLTLLGRPRVDVTLRISGFFRDAFPHLIDLFDQAVRAVAMLDEPPEQNPLAAQVRQDTQFWQEQGLSTSQAEQRSRYRIFGSKPGAYGAGLQGLIEAQNWTSDQDLARAYINWSSYAYTADAGPLTVAESFAPEAFEQRLTRMQIVLHNQDNREHDLLDSDDYYQFQGGLTAAVRSLRGQNPQTYFGDHSRPEQPRVRRLQAEIARVYRSRVVNPKWIAGVMRHGYKGAFELAATVDYLFAYDATAHCVADYMYEGIAQAYLLDPEVQAFVQQKNPWALRDMAERLLEAQQRGLWEDASPERVEELRSLVHEAEALIETQLDPH